ncbi:mitochondrial trans-2-enoyl-CoA reductase [Coemansia spiralis]|nr:mitochondrial trans-2-enoyl-CoA reductase [Coemansia spiralis]
MFSRLGWQLRPRSAQRAFRRMASNRIRAQSAVYTETGEPSQVLRVVEHEVPNADELGDTQAVVRMLASPINPSDLNQIEGAYPVRAPFSTRITGELSAVGGNEAVGEVLYAGAGSGLQIGSWVIPQRAGEFGTWSTHVVVDDAQVASVPLEWREGLEPLAVASVKVNPSTAYRLLRDFSALGPNDCVVQNGANSGVGRAVIQMARLMGVRTVNVVRERPDFGELAAELSGLGADLVVQDRELGDPAVRERIGALGPVRLGLNCVGGRATLLMTKLLAKGATLVTYGGMSRQPVTLPTSLLVFRDIRACGFWMNRWYLSQPRERRDEMWRDILGMARRGQFQTQPMARVEWPGASRVSAEEAQRAVRDAVSWSTGKRAFVFSA